MFFTIISSVYLSELSSFPYEKHAMVIDMKKTMTAWVRLIHLMYIHIYIIFHLQNLPALNSTLMAGLFLSFRGNIQFQLCLGYCLTIIDCNM